MHNEANSAHETAGSTSQPLSDASAPSAPLPAPDSLILRTTAVSTLAAFEEYRKTSAALHNAQQQYELQLISGENFTAPGYCFPCRRHVDFLVDFLYCDNEVVDGITIPNWRERVLCPYCTLNNRIRASAQFLEETLGCAADAAIYMSEQTTPLYQYLKATHPNLVGSEYLGDKIPFGEVDPASGLRNESITRLSFADDSLDFVLSFDVFEHVPDYRKALQECCRVLKPGGRLVFTVPFRFDSQHNLVRATMDKDGQIKHLLEPEYHGDPINNAGCLCFYHFGWQILDELKRCGFKSAAAHLYWSDTLGYLGRYQVIFCAVKAQAGFWQRLFRFGR